MDDKNCRLSQSDKKTVRNKCDTELQWLDKNNLAEKDEFEDHLRDCQDVCSPIMMKLHNQGRQSSDQSSGPTVEEVD